MILIKNPVEVQTTLLGDVATVVGDMAPMRTTTRPFRGVVGRQAARRVWRSAEHADKATLYACQSAHFLKTSHGI